jgi:hypothetical protein
LLLLKRIAADWLGSPKGRPPWTARPVTSIIGRVFCCPAKSEAAKQTSAVRCDTGRWTRNIHCQGAALGVRLEPRKGRACNRTDKRITVPRYFFNVRNHVHTQDFEGADLADLATAKREALRDIFDILKARSNVVGDSWQSWSIEICDLNRKVILVVPFSNN